MEKHQIRIASFKAVVASCALSLAGAATAEVPNVFTQGAPVRAHEVNTNFSELDNRVTQLEATSPVWQGAWSSSTAYQINDMVQYGGTSYIAVAPSTGVAPPSSEWDLIAAAGAQGPVGPQGPTGPAGAASPDLPAGAVMMFNLASCPTGWTELTAARGRALVGRPSGGSNGVTVGTPLASGENRLHNHGTNATDIAAWFDTNTDEAWISRETGYNSNGYRGGWFVEDTEDDETLGGQHRHAVRGWAYATVPAMATTFVGTADVMPYIQFLVCTKQ